MKYELRNQGGQPVKIEGRTVKGYAIVYNSDSHDLGGFVERFLPGSWTKAIQSGQIEAWSLHERTMPLGSQAAGTLRLIEDAVGVAYEIDLPDTSYANDLRALMNRPDGKSDIGGTSFGFMVAGSKGERWYRDGNMLRRDIAEAYVEHISPVVTPAYPATSAMLRSISGEAIEDERIDQLRKIFVARSKGIPLTKDEKNIAKEVSQLLSDMNRPSMLDEAEAKATRILL